MLTCGDLGLTPEEVETLEMSPVCNECEHRMTFHDQELGFCFTNGCHCTV